MTNEKEVLSFKTTLQASNSKMAGMRLQGVATYEDNCYLLF